MTVNAVFTGDTVTFGVNFYTTDGILMDPDSDTGTFTVYRQDNKRLIFTDDLERDSIGSYHYDWTIPAEETHYIIEMEGTFSSKPQLKRVKIKAKFEE